ncbi:Serine/threonine-protein kinase GL21140, partial [Takifugu flavidus]
DTSLSGHHCDSQRRNAGQIGEGTREYHGVRYRFCTLAWTSLDDEVLLIMERPKYCTVLFDYIDRQIDEGLAKEFTRHLVEAAIQIHKAGVFHRDLKPENILIEYDEARLIPRVCIIDFGCGCFVVAVFHPWFKCPARSTPLRFFES